MVRPKFFEFSSYSFSPRKKKITFKYKIGFASRRPIVFVENIILPKIPRIKQVPKGLLNNLLQGIHIILGVSYYKLYCPPRIKLNRPLSKEQANFWNNVYKKGLGEFFYRNDIDPKIIDFPCRKETRAKNYDFKRNDRVLLGIGGGKDSIVAIELFKKGKHKITGFVVETQKKSDVIDAVLKESGILSLKTQRVLDNKLFEQYPQSYNGHVPISAIYAFLGLLTAVLYDYSYVTVANEYSSNFGNIRYKGEIINHQWSKSAEFEQLFQDYINNFVTPDIRYFSVLRPFYEIRIVEMFSKCKRYFPHFSSCNRNFTIYRAGDSPLWCGECPKCVSLFIFLSAFISKRELLKIFKKNLYEDKKLLPMFTDLSGFGKIKPFDCVGTFEEVQAALYLAKNKFKQSVVIKKLLPKIKKPKSLIRKVFLTNPALNIPTAFRLVGMKSVLILGYGKEGQTTQKYLKEYFPEKKTGIADQSQSPNYLEKQKEYDLVIKTPGLSKKNVTVQYTTATNIFFSRIKNTIIGITGSKGKSTTTSLIYEILKQGGKKVRLLGNIGVPMLKALMGPVNKDEIFVLELSSYQLDDIEFSPNIAVITNLFPEHMDYHGGVGKYFEAKKNIIKFQSKNDFFVYNPKVARIKSWTENTNSKLVPFVQQIPLKQSEIPLLGQHNKDNIKVAITVAKLFKVSEQAIKRAIKQFKPLPHRLELIGEFKDIKFYDDAISTTPESTIMAIKSIPKIGTIFLGGEDRGYDFSNLERIIKKYKIKNIVLFPNSGKRIFKTRRGLNILETSEMEKAVKFAYKNTAKGKVCLLSTASPSYSLWKNFEEQGREFKKYIKLYAKKKR